MNTSGFMDAYPQNLCTFLSEHFIAMRSLIQALAYTVGWGAWEKSATRSPAGGAAWEGYVTFARENLAGGGTSPG